MLLHLSVCAPTRVCEAQKVSQSNCFVTHWAAEMSFLSWRSNTPYFKPEEDSYGSLAPSSAAKALLSHPKIGNIIVLG